MKSQGENMILHYVNKVFWSLWMPIFFVCTASAQNPVSYAHRELQQDACTKEDSLPFNGLNYMLQKPLGNERYTTKKFGDHLFVTGDVGLTLDRNPSSLFSSSGLGSRVGISVGDWLTPVHGIRVGVSGGFHNGLADKNPYLASVSADYLMNISSLLHGDDPNRLIDVLAFGGVEYQLLYQKGNWTHAAGFRLGFQPRVYISPLTFFYIEPRIGIYTDNIDREKTWLKYDWEASLMAGFGYRLLTAPQRHNVAFAGASKGVFFSLGGGFASTLAGLHSLNPGWTVMAAVGDDFSRFSSLRLSAVARQLKSSHIKKSSVGLQLDYMFNLHAIFGGYDPLRRFALSGLVGAGYHNIGITRIGRFNRFNFGAGLHGELRLAGHWSLFVEPRVDVFPNMAWRDGTAFVDPLPSLSAGITYRPTPFVVDKTLYEDKDFDYPRRIGDLYLTIGGGFAGVMQASVSQPIPNKGMRFFGGLGTWWNAVSGTRLLLNASRINAAYSKYRTYAMGAQLDYLLNFSHLLRGYDPDRLFTVSGVAGVNYDYVSSQGAFRHSIGVGAGLQGAFRFNEMFGLFVEPRINVNQDNRWAENLISRVDVVPTLTVGLSYHLYGYGMRHGKWGDNETFVNESFPDHMFYGVNVAPVGILHHALVFSTKERLGAMASVYGGKWFSPVSGFRLTAGVGFFGDAKPGYRKFGLLELDYLWDINAALFGYKEQRLFNASVGVGPVLAYVTGANTGLYPGMGVSLKGEWGFPSGFGLFIEPQMRIFGQKFSTERVASLPVDFLLSMNVGVRYKLDGYDSANNSSEYEQSKKIFVSAAYGGKLLYAGQGKFSGGHGVALSVGKWFSPLSAWRIDADFGGFDGFSEDKTLMLSADYLFNLSTHGAGFSNDRLFDAIALVGLSAGIGGDSNLNRFVYGAKVGLQGRFRVTSDIDLLIEPQGLLTCTKLKNGRKLDSEGRLFVGISYKL